jgi:hypothetical protein
VQSAMHNERQAKLTSIHIIEREKQKNIEMKQDLEYRKAHFEIN